MKNSHVNMQSRYDRVMKFLEGVSSSQIRELLPDPVEVSSLGLSVVHFDKRRLMFGDGYQTNQYSALDNYRSLIRHKVFKRPNSEKRIGIIPLQNNGDRLELFSKQIERIYNQLELVVK